MLGRAFFMLMVCMPNMLMAGEPNLKVKNTRHFVLYYDEHQEELAERLADRAERDRAKLLAAVGGHQDFVIQVVLASSPDVVRRWIPKGIDVPEWAAGLAFSRNNLMILRSYGHFSSMVGDDTLFLHELSHLLLDHAVGFKWLPRWFKEGFAIYQSGEWSLQRAGVLASGVISNRLFSLKDLERQFPSKQSDVELAYAQSIDFVGYLLGEMGVVPFSRLVKLLSQDWSFFLALEMAYNRDIDSIEADWLHDLRIRYTWIPVVTGSAVLWFLGALVLISAYVRKRIVKERNLQALEDELDIEDSPPPESRGNFLH